MKQLILAGILVAELVFFTVVSGPELATIGDWVQYHVFYLTDVIAQSAPILFLAFGMTLVLMTAGIDLSVGSMACLIACAMASFDAGGAFWITAVPCGLALALVLGLTNGFLIATLDIPPIIATLGTMIFYRGWCFVVMGDLEKDPFLGVPGYALLGEFPFVVSCVLLVYGAGGVWFHRSRWRRELRLVGGNSIAARYAGIRVQRRLCEVYVLVGVLAFLAALTFTARNGSVSGSSMLGLELRVIVAVVLGGTRVEGGMGSTAGSLLGVLIIAVLEEGLRSSVGWGERHLPFKISHLEYLLLGVLLVGGVWLNKGPRGRGSRGMTKPQVPNPKE